MRPRKYDKQEDYEDDEQEEEEEAPVVPKRVKKKEKDNMDERYDLVHQTELLGIRDNETGEIKRFSIEQEIIEIKNILDKIAKGLV